MSHYMKVQATTVCLFHKSLFQLIAMHKGRYIELLLLVNVSLLFFDRILGLVVYPMPPKKVRELGRLLGNRLRVL